MQLKHKGAQAEANFYVQVLEYMNRITKADAEASKAQSDANKAHKLARQLETDVQALRWDALCLVVYACPMHSFLIEVCST